MSEDVESLDDDEIVRTETEIARVNKWIRDYNHETLIIILIYFI